MNLIVQQQQQQQTREAELLTRIDRLQTAVQQGTKRISTNSDLAKWTLTELQAIEREYNTSLPRLQKLRDKYDILSDRLSAGSTIAEANKATTLLTSDERLANTFATALRKNPIAPYRSPPRARRRGSLTSTACNKCGRKNHKTANCFAKTHIDGTVLKSE
jgi:hypothetical protein